MYYTNSFQINNAMDSVIENGDSLNLGYYFSINTNPLQNGSFFLPSPGDSTHCYYIYMRPDYFQGVFPLPVELQFAKIEIIDNNNNSKVVEKNEVVLSGGLDKNYNHPSAVQHANGRDWWILVPFRMEPKFYRILLSPEGFSEPEEQAIGSKMPTNDPNKYFGYNKFSPDGSRYSEFDIRNGTLQLFDFDRCTGLLSNPYTVQIIGSPMDPTYELDYSSIAYSPNGNIFYLMYGNLTGAYFVQFDLASNDLLASMNTILFCPPGNNIFDCSISRAVLAPNGKIYVGAAIDTVAYHVINKPDSLGTACDFEFGGFEFPATLPNGELSDFPNYRLGPIDGSPCDTLGINNIPVASFFWDATELAVDFSNVSYYEPDSFLWDFGDGVTSTAVNPLHTYAAPGSYNTCLTASNVNGSHTLCKLVEVDTLPAPPILPVAAFTWDAVELAVTFANNSYNAPTDFLWDFGDGSTSTEANPLYTYAAPGSYNTCLTASNANGSDTLCQLVLVDTLLDSTSHVVALDIHRTITIHPNPTTGQLSMGISMPLPQAAIWSLHDALGRELSRAVLSTGQQEMAVGLAGVPPGLYFWQLSMEGRVVGNGKVIVME